MGNLLCKKSRGDSPISPVDRVIGRCAQICPQSIGKKKHFWDKQVLETSPPPLNQQPKLGSPLKGSEQTGWETATLTVPDSPGNGIMAPVAPPRKKRPSMSPKKEISKKAEQDMKNNCKENSTEEIVLAKVLATDSKIDSLQESFDTTDSSEEPSSPTKIIPAIGNEKSDKFFGEQISHTLSSEEILIPNEEKKTVQIVDADKPSLEKDEVDNIKKLEPDKISESLFEVTEESEELRRNINKETGNLIFDLEKQINKTECPGYEGQTPVVEEIIVPVKRKARHVCDDEDCLRKLLHGTPSPDSSAPKKPQRDFTKYKKSLDNFKSQEGGDSSQNQKSIEEKVDNRSAEKDVIDSEQQKNIKNKFEISKAEVMSDGHNLLIESQEKVISKVETISANEEAQIAPPPPIPPKLKKKSVTPPVRSESENAENTKQKFESVPPNMSNSEKILRRCLSSQSYLTPELVEKIAEQANSLSVSTLYLPEDYSSLSNDGSGLVSPNYKLTEKRKLSSQISTTSQAKSDDGRNVEYEKENEKCEKEINTDFQTIVIIEQPKDATTVEKTEAILSEKAPENLEKTLETLQNNNHTEVEKSQTNSITESLANRKLKKRISVNSSSPEDISKTIQTFINKNDLSPQTLLKLLEDEFGDVLNCKNLAPDDKRTIEELRKSATNNQNSFTQENNTTKVRSAPKPDDSVNEVETAQSKAATLESNAKLTKSHHSSKIPKLKNKALDVVASGEKRRHSIDELESWFSPKSENTEDVAEVKRRRESSLPNCLDSPVGENTPPFFTDLSKIETNKTITENTCDHSSLLKFLEREKTHYQN